MRRIRSVFIVLLVAIILGTMSLASGVSAAGTPVNAQSDIQLAQQSGQQYISTSGLKICGAWGNAKLANGTPCYDLQNDIIGYMFSILQNGKYLGYIVVGSSDYDFDSLEAVNGAPLPSINETDAQAIFTAVGDQVVNLQPKLVYLGYRQFYSIYSSGNTQLAIDLTSKTLVGFNTLISSLATPEQYIQNIDAVGSAEQSIQPDMPTVNLSVPLKNDGAAPGINNCGPTSGAMNPEYYKTWCPALLNWIQDESQLYIYMYCNNWGLFGLMPGTSPTYFGPGWVQYANIIGYPYFATDWCLNRSFSAIQTEINDGRPCGVMFSYFNNYANWHWCVVTGWDTSGNLYLNDPNGGYYTSTNWAANQTTSVITRIF